MKNVLKLSSKVEQRKILQIWGVSVTLGVPFGKGSFSFLSSPEGGNHNPETMENMRHLYHISHAVPAVNLGKMAPAGTGWQSLL